jgi:pectin methylesterase-like acyl-CoA thioesterase
MTSAIPPQARRFRSVRVSGFLISGAVALLGCSSGSEDDGANGGNGAGVGGTPSGTGASATTGGTTATGGGVSTGGTASTGGVPSGGATSTGGALTGGSGGVATGGVPSTPVDCAPIVAAGFDLCESGTDFCAAVYDDGTGCVAVCQAAGLACDGARENLDGACGADESLPALPCDSGHQSDYCICRGEVAGTGGAGSGGAPGTGGEASGGSSSGGAASGGASSGGSASGGGGNVPANADCNDITSQPVIVVKKDGSGHFTTVQAAIDSLPKSNTTPTQIRIAPDTYTEKLRVDRPNITLCGQKGQAAATILTYGDNANTSNGQGGTLGTSGSASTNISASKVSAENVTFKNNTPLGGSQAVALLITGSEVQFRNCRFLSYQDTLYTKGGSQYFKDCYVEGSVDYIFGGATAVFDECTIHTAAGGTAVTAPSTDQAIPFGLVFLGGELTAASSVSSGSQALGRNWGAYGAAAYIGTVLGKHISTAGWSPMGSNTLATARFSEYQTTGPGSHPTQRAQSKQLTSAEAAAYTVDNILGSWTPTFSQ